MNIKQAEFIEYLKDKHLDEAAHQIYADWLEENNQPEEADRQRKYVKSAKWMYKIASQGGQTCENYYANIPYSEYKYAPITFEILIQAGHDCVNALTNGEYWGGFTQMGSQKLSGLFYGPSGKKRIKTYWKHWAIITGCEPPKPTKWGPQVPFSCSC